jgi:hypothetical protein
LRGDGAAAVDGKDVAACAAAGLASITDYLPELADRIGKLLDRPL